MNEKIVAVQSIADSWGAEDVLRWALAEFGRDVAISSAFGAEGMTIIDMASRIQPDFRIFTIDTEFLFPETYALMDRIEQRYGVRIERIYSTLSPEAQEGAHGPALWNRNPDQCCNLRKVEPLCRKLNELCAWITGIRRDQTPSRAASPKVAWDKSFGLVKVNPIADWSSQQVWRYLIEHNVPYNPLHDRNFPSIGCTHCTRAIRVGEDQRAGRWSGFSKTECGLHLIQPAPTSEAGGIKS